MSYYRKRRVNYSTPNVQKTANFIWMPDIEAYSIKIDYDKGRTPTFVDLIKSAVPSNMKDYEPSTYTWFIKPGENNKYYSGMLAAAQAIFTDYKFFTYTKEQYEEANRATGNFGIVDNEKNFTTFTAYATQLGFNVTKSTPLADASKIYRKLAIKWHPDKNPENGPIMSEINEAWSNLKGTVFI